MKTGGHLVLLELCNLDRSKILQYGDIKENSYTIDENGNIYSFLSHKYLKASKDKDGYLHISLENHNRTRGSYRIATLVAIHYIGEPPISIQDPTVDHMNSNRLDNNYKNLQWISRGMNSSKRLNKGRGASNHEAKLTEKNVLEIANLLSSEKLTLTEIANQYNVDKSTISNIKRKKTWAYLTDNYSFNIKKQKSKRESIIQKNEIIKSLISGLSATYLIKKGYPQTVVYRYKKYINQRKAGDTNEHNKD